MSESRSLRVRCLSIIFGIALIAAGCGGDAEDAGPAVTVSRTSTPATTAPTTTESTTTTEEVEEDEDEEEETTTTEVPTTLEFADQDNSSSGNGGDSSGASSGGGSATTAAPTTETRAPGDGQTLPPTTTIPSTTTTTDDSTNTESTIATTTTIDPFAPLVNFDQAVIPHSDADTSVSINTVNLKCDANGISPQLMVVAPFDLNGVQQFVTFYGPSGAAYIVSGQVGSGQLETFTDWRSDPVVADSFDWVAICSQPSWKVLIELADQAGGLFSVVADTTISG